MNITVNRQRLADAMAEIMPIIPAKPTLPILKFAKVTTRGSRMKIEGTDTYTTIYKYIDLDSNDVDGTFLLDCALCSALLSKIKDTDITLTVDDETVVISHAKGKGQFQIQNAQMYPQSETTTDDVTVISIPANTLCDCISKAMNFVGSDELRPQMKVIYAEVKDGCFNYCATDTRMMLANSVAIPVESEIDTHWFIEPSAFKAIIKAGKNLDVIEIKVSQNKTSYRLGDTVIHTLLTKGNFPAYRRVIPATWSHQCTVSTKDIIESVGRVALFGDEAKTIRIDISTMDMSISAENMAQIKKTSETVTHDGCAGGICIGLQSDYLLTCLKTCDSDKVTLRLSDPSRPVIFYDEVNPSMTILQMPMVIR